VVTAKARARSKIRCLVGVRYDVHSGLAHTGLVARLSRFSGSTGRMDEHHVGVSGLVEGERTEAGVATEPPSNSSRCARR
jgi:hypothetical protein